MLFNGCFLSLGSVTCLNRSSLPQRTGRTLFVCFTRHQHFIFDVAFVTVVGRHNGTFACRLQGWLSRGAQGVIREHKVLLLSFHSAVLHPHSAEGSDALGPSQGLRGSLSRREQSWRWGPLAQLR